MRSEVTEQQELSVTDDKRGKSLRGAINAFCKWCIHDPQSGLGAWREQVQGCTATDCPLYPVRPKSKSTRSRRSSENVIPLVHDHRVGE